MKTLKIGIVLLAFLLAAMVMVPMVNATTAVNYSLVSDVVRCHFRNYILTLLKIMSM